MTVRKALGHLITCQHAARLVSTREERPLRIVDQVLLKLHLAWCVACRRFERQMRLLRKAMRSYSK